MERFLNRKNHSVIALFVTIVSAIILACSSDSSKLVFKDANDALNACHRHLHKITDVNSMNMNDLAKYTTKWIELQDTTYVYIIRDSNAVNNIDITDDYYTVSDSVRNEITRLALAKTRTMEEVIDFKLNTIPDKNKIQSSKAYKKAVSFYKEADKNAIYTNNKEMLVKYKKILSEKPFANQQELEDFLIKEDVCYRSLMACLDKVSQKQLQNIISATAGRFDKLYQQVANDIENDRGNEYLKCLLTVRLNRRIMQNAKVCYLKIKNGDKIKPYQVDNYRWMIIQPFLTIHGPAMAMLTEEEVSLIKTLSSELTDVLAQIDGMSLKKTPESEVEKLSSALSNYFLKTYLREII